VVLSRCCAQQGGGSRGPQPADHGREVKYFIALTRNSTATIDSSARAARLLTAAVAFAEADGKPAMLYQLATLEGRNALRMVGFSF
jgi:hypothetical protein